LSKDTEKKKRKGKDACAPPPAACSALDLAIKHVGVVNVAEHLLSRDTTTEKQTIDDEAIISAEEPDQDQLRQRSTIALNDLQLCPMHMLIVSSRVMLVYGTPGAKGKSVRTTRTNNCTKKDQSTHVPYHVTF
jgi:hypothetical protein